MKKRMMKIDTSNIFLYETAPPKEKKCHTQAYEIYVYTYCGYVLYPHNIIIIDLYHNFRAIKNRNIPRVSPDYDKI